MTHRAEQIMQAVVTNVTGLVTTGTNVFRARDAVLPQTSLPALLVYTGDDVPQAMYSQELIDSELRFYIEAIAKSPTAQLDTLLNLIRSEVTVALQADFTQGLQFVIETLEGTADEPELQSEGDQPIAKMRMNWRIIYRRSRTNPDA